MPFNTALLNKVTLGSACCVLALSLSGYLVAQDGPSANPSAMIDTQNQPASSVASSTAEVASSELPDSPGTAWGQSQDASTPQNSSSQSATPSSPQTENSQAASAPDQTQKDQTQKPQRPVGTAAAEAPKVNGVTAAQPSGVAIAPAKQRRVRTIVLKVGAMVGAGVAVGTVIALTAGTPSKPPGAH
jgi:hypothetical protein